MTTTNTSKEQTDIFIDGKINFDKQDEVYYSLDYYSRLSLSRCPSPR